MTAPEDDRPRRLSQQLAWSIAIAFIAVVGISGAGVAYTNHVQRESDRRWCDLFAALDPPEAPPTNERGKVIGEEIHRLRVGFGCPER